MGIDWSWVKATGGLRGLGWENIGGGGWLFDDADRRDAVVVRRSLEGATLRISDVRYRDWTTGSGRESIIVAGGSAIVGGSRE